jgi:DNA-binding MarR family transcriptional regulator
MRRSAVLPASPRPPIRAAARHNGVAAPGADRDALERTLTYRLHRLHKLTERDSLAAYPETVGLSMSDGRSLITIGAFEPLSVTDLAAQAHLDKGQASRAAQALVEQGLVHKEEHARDGRGVVLALTPAGRRLFRRTMALAARRNDEIFGCLSAAERATFSRLLDRLIAHARAGRDAA